MVRKDYPDVCITCGKVLEDDEIAVKSQLPYGQTVRQANKGAKVLNALSEEQKAALNIEPHIPEIEVGKVSKYRRSPHIQCVECSEWAPDGYADLDDFIEKTGFDVNIPTEILDPDDEGGCEWTGMNAAEVAFDNWNSTWLRYDRPIKPKPCRGCGRPLVVAELYAGKKPLSRTCSPRCSAKASRGTRMHLTERACHHCADMFTPKRKDARFCSPKCRAASHRLKAKRAHSV